MKRLFQCAVFAAGATWLVSCAQQVGDIDQTQPDRIDVSMLNDGKPWWFLQTVIDIPPQSGLTFIGDASNGSTGTGISGISRIVWDVEENWLIAYNNYEFIVGSQTPYSAIENDTVLGNGTPASRTPYFGTPVAAYAITSHFDIEREYNAQTGEQENVITENTTDRPWYERQYIRVDWGNNAFGGFNFMYETYLGTNTGTVVTSPLSYYVDQADPSNPDAMTITPSYIGIVNKVSYTALLDPDLTKAWGMPVYQCEAQQAFQLGVGDCGPGEVKIRLSFEKVPDNHDFVPRNYTQKDELMFGVWENSQLVYDQERGYVEPEVEADSMATMHHIWQADHRATDLTTGAPCNVNDTSNPNCIMPLNQRTPKPIVYYVSPGWPDISDNDHYMMWVHEGLISDDYNSDMRSVVAGALRGWNSSANDGGGDYLSTSVEYWVEHTAAKAADGGISPVVNSSGINYDTSTTPVYSYSRYKGASGIDYLSYPPELNPSTMPSGEDLSSTAADGTRPAGTWISNSDNDTLCTASQITQSKQAVAVGKTGPCHICDPTKYSSETYCMGIESVPYTVVPRMVVFCHNPVEPRQWGKYNGSWTNPETAVTYPNIDKSDSTQEASFDFSSPGDPDICDPRSDSDRIATPLSPQLGDLRYSMHAWIPEPDTTSPGGIGEPATDPTTGEIVSAHANVYARAIEGNASTGADIVAVLNGWETYADLINGNIVDDYLTALQSKPGLIFSPSSISNMMMGPAGQQKIATIQAQAGFSPNGPGGLGGTFGGGSDTTDYGVANWTILQPVMETNDPTMGSEIPTDFAPGYGPGMALPSSVQQQLTMSNLVAPPSVSTFNSAYNSTRNAQIAAHVLMDEDIEPTALRLAKYYKDKFAAHDPCLNTNGITSAASADYKTCIWEQARRQILGNIWRSYSDHEVGHTFGMYHNFAGSTDALNYFDPYWDLRQTNLVNTGKCASGDTACADVTASIGTTPGNVALAPEWVQAPSYSTLQNGLREYQYTSIMDYNARTFNADFQGLGKYDHATHMYQYGDMVEIFDPSVLSKVPANTDTTNHPHQIDDQVLQPFNAHYTMYPWIIADGALGQLTEASTPLPEAIQKMVHARKWVRYDDLTSGATPDLPLGLTDADVKARDGFSSVSTLTAPSTVMVPYRFCGDDWEGGTAWCMAFDQGADAYEQATGFIQDYKFYYYFSNFKRQSATFDLNDALLYPGVWASSYYSGLWNRNYIKQIQIAQNWVNDEFIVRPNVTCPHSVSGERHYAALACGQDRVAGVVSTVDFMTKLMQSPQPDVLEFDSANNILCGSQTCQQGFFGNTGNQLSAITKMNLTLQPGESARADISTYSIDQYGKNYYYEPVSIGIWLDKVLAAEALGDYYTFFVGELNSQPLNWSISLSDYFQNDIVRAMGSLILDDPRYWPLVAVNTTNPSDPANPPVTLYRNSNALVNLQTSFFGALVTPWCPSGDPSCQAAPPTQTGSSGLGYQPTWEAPPPGYQVLTMPASQLGTSQPIYPPGTSGNVVVPVDPAPVYFEKILMLAMGAVFYTQSGVGNYQDFLQGIKITQKGDAYDATNPNALECDGHPDWVIVPQQTTCQGGAVCSVDNLCAANTGPCALRNWNCAGSATAAAAGILKNPGTNEEYARTLSNGGTQHPGLLTGICYYGPTGVSSANFGYQNCDPDFYQEYTDGSTGTTYYSTRYTPTGGDITDSVIDPYTVYAPAYEVMGLAQNQAANPGASGLSGYNLILLMQQMYQYWTTYQAFYGTPWAQRF